MSSWAARPALVRLDAVRRFQVTHVMDLLLQVLIL